jgi:hypothetical protein
MSLLFPLRRWLYRLRGGPFRPFGFASSESILNSLLGGTGPPFTGAPFAIGFPVATGFAAGAAGALAVGTGCGAGCGAGAAGTGTG